MTRGITTALNTQLTSDELEPFFAVDLDFDGGNVRIWTGYGNITVDSETFVGSGDILNISGLTETADVQANGITITLSGLDSSLIASALTETYQGRSCKVYFGALSSGAVVADPYIVFSGRMDVMTIDDGGDTSDITVTAESRLIDLDRARNRRYTTEDQKIDYPSDRGLEFIADLQDKQIIWGR
jgi:hypothetical protein